MNASAIERLLSRMCHTPGATWAKANLDEEARCDFPDITRPNPLLDPADCAAWVKKIARQHFVTNTYGGYMEDRAHLWRGSYLTGGVSPGTVHLGVDVNVPTGTEIGCPKRFRPAQLFRDPDQSGGWGGRAVVELENGALIVFGHLVIASLRLSGVWYDPDTLVGTVAPSSKNGGWFPHLHLQGLAKFEPDFDGYGPGGVMMEARYPNPLLLLAD